MTSPDLTPLLTRVAEALERLSPPPTVPGDLPPAPAYVWEGATGQVRPVAAVDAVPLSLLVGVDRQREALLANTRAFAAGHPANNALLWGARGMGKSSLVKAVHSTVLAERPGSLALVEIHREDLTTLGRLMALLRAAAPRRFILFCDDLSFDASDGQYRSLKALLEGGVEGRPANVLLYATSNRRHLMPREMVENEQSTAINPSDAVEDKVSLSDRFGLWLGFHACDQAAYLSMVAGYAAVLDLPVDAERLRAEAVAWAAGRGARSGRVAWQFVQDLAGRLGLARPG